MIPTVLQSHQSLNVDHPTIRFSVRPHSSYLVVMHRVSCKTMSLLLVTRTGPRPDTRVAIRPLVNSSKNLSPDREQSFRLRFRGREQRDPRL